MAGVAEDKGGRPKICAAPPLRPPAAAAALASGAPFAAELFARFALVADGKTAAVSSLAVGFCCCCCVVVGCCCSALGCEDCACTGAWRFLLRSLSRLRLLPSGAAAAFSFPCRMIG